MIYLEYEIEDSGWARGLIGNGENEVEFDISYLHDSLKELTESAIGISKKESKTVVFMAEPGEVQLFIKNLGKNKIQFEVRLFKDWASWGMVENDDYEIVLNGLTTIPKYINQVRQVLKKIIEEIGIKIYKEKWIQHDFPLAEYEILK